MKLLETNIKEGDSPVIEMYTTFLFLLLSTPRHE